VPEPTCINFTERFGARYRIAFDPAYDPKHRPRDKLDPWSMVIPCRRGEIYPYGGETLVVEVEGRPIIRRRLNALACTTPHQEVTTSVRSASRWTTSMRLQRSFCHGNGGS
jgi:hypothetical protein